MRLAAPATLTVLALLLLGGIGYEILAPLDPVVVEVPRISQHATPAAAPRGYVPPPESDFADIDARPLFSSARKPLPDSSQPSATLSASSDFSLVGVIMDSNRAVALIHTRSTNATTSAVLGDDVSGWHVVKIEPAAVTLRANGADAVVGLEGPAVGAPSAPLARASSTNATGDAAVPVAAAPVPAATPSAPPTPALAQPAPPPLMPVAATQRPTATAPGQKPHRPYIAPEALRGASVDPATGEPVL